VVYLDTDVGDWHVKESFPVVVLVGISDGVSQILLQSSRLVGHLVCFAEVRVGRHSRHLHLQTTHDNGLSDYRRFLMAHQHN